MVMPMQATAKSPDRLVMDFYLPCAISGVLLAGLIALTTPIATAEMAQESSPVVALR